MINKPVINISKILILKEGQRKPFFDKSFCMLLQLATMMIFFDGLCSSINITWPLPFLVFLSAVCPEQRG